MFSKAEKEVLLKLIKNLETLARRSSRIAKSKANDLANTIKSKTGATKDFKETLKAARPIGPFITIKKFDNGNEGRVRSKGKTACKCYVIDNIMRPHGCTDGPLTIDKTFIALYNGHYYNINTDECSISLPSDNNSNTKYFNHSDLKKVNAKRVYKIPCAK